MGIFSRNARKVKEVLRFDGPGAKGGASTAYFNIYVYEDDSCRTVEFDHKGAHLFEYTGEPVFPDSATPTPLPDGAPPMSIPPIPPKPLPKPANPPPAGAK